MRTKSSNEQYFNFAGESSLKIVNEYREKYEMLSTILDDNPNLLSQAHQDWVQLLSTSDEGRDGYTSEQLLRALIVLFTEGKDYRNTVVLIDTSERAARANDTLARRDDDRAYASLVKRGMIEVDTSAYKAEWDAVAKNTREILAGRVYSKSLLEAVEQVVAPN